MIKTGKTIDVVMLVRSIAPRVGLREAKKIVEEFAANN
jgi:ribosomal protein L7/L12